MSDLTVLTNQVSMTSKDIADLLGSRHSDVKLSVERLMDKGIIAQSAMAFMQETKGNNRTYDIGYYTFTGEQGKRDTIIIVAQIRPEITAKIVDRWLELEQRNQTPTTYIEALKQLIYKEEEKQALVEKTQQLTHQKELAKLENGKSVYGATIKQVNQALNATYTWQPLKKYCDEHNLELEYVFPNGYSSISVMVYPYNAWLDVYEVDLDLLFKE